MKDWFVDTSYFIALAFSADENHPAARAHWARLIPGSVRFLTTSLILTEVVAYCASRHRPDIARSLGRLILGDQGIDYVHVDANLQHEAWQFYLRRPDKGYSLTDCVSFILMERTGVSEALTFDHHFEQAGFIRLPA